MSITTTTTSSSPSSSHQHDPHHFNNLNQRKRDAAKLFSNIDVNRDGALDRDELFDALRRLNLPTSKTTFDKFFSRLDQDGDNLVSLAEFENFVEARYRELEESFELLVACGEENEKMKILNYHKNNDHHSHHRGESGKNNQTKNTTHQKINDGHDDEDQIPMISAVICSPNIPTSPAVSKKFLTADSFRQAAKFSGVHLSDDDLRRIITHLDAGGDDRVSFEEFVDALMLCPFDVNPAAFFDSWFVDSFVDDGGDYTIPREIRITPPIPPHSTPLVHHPVVDENSSSESKNNTPDHHHHHQQKSSIISVAIASSSTSNSSCSSLSSTTPPPTFLQIAAKKLLLGGFAGFLSRTLTAPIDRVRILMMTAKDRISISHAIKQSVSDGGIRALWKGNGVNCVKITPEMAIKLFVFDMLKKSLANDSSNITFTERLLSGSVAGLLSQTTVYPLEVVRTRMAVGAPVGEAPYRGIMDCIRRTFHEGATRSSSTVSAAKIAHSSTLKSSTPASLTSPAAATVLHHQRHAPPRSSSILGGIKIFYSGVPASALGILPFAGIDLSLNSYLKDLASDHLKKQGREVSVPLLLSCGMISSSIATVCTFPLNVIRTKAQHTGESVVKITRDIFTQVDMKTGLKPTVVTVLRRLYTGTIPCVLKIGPATSLSYTSYEWLQRKWK